MMCFGCVPGGFGYRRGAFPGQAADEIILAEAGQAVTGPGRRHPKARHYMPAAPRPGDAVNCHEVSTLLGRFLDGELPREVNRKVRQHLSGCAHCRDNYRTYTEVVRGIALATDTDKDQPLPESLVWRIMQAAIHMHDRSSFREN